MKMDRIGYFKGEPISEMTREKLLDFAQYAGKRITELQKIEEETQDYRISLETQTEWSDEENKPKEWQWILGALFFPISITLTYIGSWIFQRRTDQ